METKKLAAFSFIASNPKDSFYIKKPRLKMVLNEVGFYES